MAFLILVVVLLSPVRADVKHDSSKRTKEFRAQLAASAFDARRCAAIEVSRAGDNSGVPMLIEAMSSLTNQNDRNNCVVAHRLAKDHRAIPVFVNPTDDPSQYIRGVALAALGEMKATSANIGFGDQR